MIFFATTVRDQSLMVEVTSRAIHYATDQQRDKAREVLVAMHLTYERRQTLLLIFNTASLQFDCPLNWVLRIRS